MKLRLRGRDGVAYNISDDYNMLGFSQGDQEIDLDIVQKSFTAGAAFIGERRLKSKELRITVEIGADDAENTDAEYRSKLNEVLYYATNTEYIEDYDETNLRTLVEFKGYSNQPLNEVGTFLKYSTLELTFEMLNPYWEGDEVSDSFTSDDTTEVINNAGSLPTPIDFHIETTAACESLSLWIDSNKQGIEIQDLDFGVDSTLYDYYINNSEGQALLGDNEIIRNEKIKLNTGFFELPVGSQSLNFLASISVTVNYSFRPRYYI